MVSQLQSTITAGAVPVSSPSAYQTNTNTGTTTIIQSQTVPPSAKR